MYQNSLTTTTHSIAVVKIVYISFFIKFLSYNIVIIYEFNLLVY